MKGDGGVDGPAGASIWNKLTEAQINGVKTGGALVLCSGLSYLVTSRVAGYLFMGIGAAGVAAVVKNPEYRTGDVRADLTRMCDDATRKIITAATPYFQVKEEDKGAWATIVRNIVALLPPTRTAE